MPRKRTKMKKIREIIRLKEDCQFSMRQISKTLKVSRTVVTKATEAFNKSNISLDVLSGMSDTDLEQLLFNTQEPTTKADLLRLKFPEYAIELKKKGVTLQLLWEEYIEENPDGLRSTQFNFHFHKWKQDKKISMHIDHKAGDKMYIDYTGNKMEIEDRKTGLKRSVEVYVAILPASQLTYVEASLSQNQEDFMRSTERAIRYFGGVPSALVPDNLKSGVITASIYEPIINNLFADFADHYRTAVVPARARKPKDKAHVENAVKISYRRIFAPLRNNRFYSLEELNEAINIKLEIHNNKKLSKMKVSRRELFEEVERKELRSLPAENYPLRHIQEGRVAINYHVELRQDHHYYSVPYILRGKQVKLIYDEKNVAIYHDNIRVVQHKRCVLSHKYTTKKEHMPEKHRFKDNWNLDKLKRWAGNIGKDTLWVISHILDSKRYPEQAYKSCLGILSNAKKHGNDLLELACRKACNAERINYKYISEEIVKIKNQYDRDEEDNQPSLLPAIHKNIRGKEFYK